jgi:hypothetical protein
MGVYEGDPPDATLRALDEKAGVSRTLTAEKGITIKDEEPFDDEMSS